MPHNLYLHSSIAQARKFDRNDDAGESHNSFHYLGFKYSINCRFCRKLFVVNFGRNYFMEPTVELVNSEIYLML